MFKYRNTNHVTTSDAVTLHYHVQSTRLKNPADLLITKIASRALYADPHGHVKNGPYFFLYCKIDRILKRKSDVGDGPLQAKTFHVTIKTLVLA